MERITKVDDLLQDMVEHNASDLFLKAGQRPCMRVDGEIVMTDYSEMTMDETHSIALQLMTEEQAEFFGQTSEMDLAVGVRGVGRFRVNVFRQRGSTGLVFRYVSNPSFSFDELNLPQAVRDLAERRRGMALVTGTTGSGKSTTLAAIIHHINHMRKCHIVTVEDPIEFLHQDELAIINQREVGFDTKSFNEALRHVLRQSPDVILIGEMRDLETISTSIAAAETGHLVLSTLHTIDAVQTVERIINYFPAYLHPQIRLELSLSLNGVISQRLLPLASGKGRIPAVEVMMVTSTIRKLLHEGKTLELPQHIEAGHHTGMQTFNQSLLQLYRTKRIKMEDALLYATSPDEFRLMADGIASGVKQREFGAYR
ncbi:type IV pili twitching motility protein PilT [candidate division BRC1 bacterium HGW-BRC1-1]|jgi:twitching motility protein PilT|nr:MAG: type IV pili twitching motility protein PilT [candidate division BRC1 bacterium HGW-BRC1-1]